MIHGDFEKHFICGEVMKFKDLHELGSESAVKAAGLYMQKVSWVGWARKAASTSRYVQ